MKAPIGCYQVKNSMVDQVDYLPNVEFGSDSMTCGEACASADYFYGSMRLNYCTCQNSMENLVEVDSSLCAEPQKEHPLYVYLSKNLKVIDIDTLTFSK